MKTLKIILTTTFLLIATLGVKAEIDTTTMINKINNKLAFQLNNPLLEEYLALENWMFTPEEWNTNKAIEITADEKLELENWMLNFDENSNVSSEKEEDKIIVEAWMLDF